MTQEKQPSNLTFTTNNEIRNMIATIVKERRKELNYTQQELADISNISLRSIQRIEKGEVVPRMFTLKTLAKFLDFSLDFLNQEKVSNTQPNREVFIRKVIISIFVVLITLSISLAYIFQSPNFPETSFEFMIYFSAIITLLFFILLKIWGTNKNSNN